MQVIIYMHQNCLKEIKFEHKQGRYKSLFLGENLITLVEVEIFL